jgi:hypothetical protein
MPWSSFCTGGGGCRRLTELFGLKWEKFKCYCSRHECISVSPVFAYANTTHWKTATYSEMAFHSLLMYPLSSGLLLYTVQPPQTAVAFITNINSTTHCWYTIYTRKLHSCCKYSLEQNQIYVVYFSLNSRLCFPFLHETVPTHEWRFYDFVCHVTSLRPGQSSTTDRSAPPRFHLRQVSLYTELLAYHKRQTKHIVHIYWTDTMPAPGQEHLLT